MKKIIHPTLVPVNGINFQVSAPCELTYQQALNAVLIFLQTHKVKKYRGKKKIVVIDICDEFLLNFVKG